ncbi:MAG: kelch repeat-containing protein [Tepidisphaeraceae bacterium]
MRPLIEGLENRQLFHSAFSASINFQPLNAQRAPGMLTDYGGEFAVRRGGLSYGWSIDMQDQAVDRNLTTIQKNDTFITMQKTVADNGAGTLVRPTWDIAVENGLYQVYIVAGDPGGANERMAVTAEGEVAVSGITRKAKRYIEGLVTVNVTDGKLTIGTAEWADVNKICYVGIVSTEAPATNTVTIETPQQNAVEGGTNGVFRITRDGPSLSSAVTIPLTIGGTATNGVDYGRFGTSVTLAANVASIDLPVRAVSDGITETNGETVTVTLGTVAGYSAIESAATVTIQDPDAPPAPTNITWATKASRPVAASEILSGTIGNKLYTFGGFVDTTYHPAKSAYSYDVTTNTWTRLTDLPVGLTHAGVTDDGTRYIYFAGGYPGNGSGGQQTFSSTTVYRYDTQSDSYSTITSLPSARGAGALGMVGSVLYFVAGENSSRQDVTTVWALDLNNTGAGWVTKASLPSARNHAAAIGLNGYLYIVGGQTGNDEDTVTQSPTYRYNPNTNTWTTLASIPTARSHIADAAFVYDDRIVILGGQSGYNAPIASNVIYDPDTNAWTTLNSLPDSRYSGAGAYVGGKFVYTAGIKSNFAATTWVGTLS